MNPSNNTSNGPEKNTIIDARTLFARNDGSLSGAVDTILIDRINEANNSLPEVVRPVAEMYEQAVARTIN
jgi:hypothetical protein